MQHHLPTCYASDGPPHCKQQSLFLLLFGALSEPNFICPDGSARYGSPCRLTAFVCLRRSARRNNEIRIGERGSSGPVYDLAGNAVRYPENLTVNNLLYFLAAPTLVYQVAYPRSQRFRIRWVIK